MFCIIPLSLLLHIIVAVWNCEDTKMLSIDTITTSESPFSVVTLILVAIVSGLLLLIAVVLSLADKICSRSPPSPIYSSLIHSRMSDPLVIQVKFILNCGLVVNLAFSVLLNVTAGCCDSGTVYVCSKTSSQIIKINYTMSFLNLVAILIYLPASTRFKSLHEVLHVRTKILFL